MISHEYSVDVRHFVVPLWCNWHPQWPSNIYKQNSTFNKVKFQLNGSIVSSVLIPLSSIKPSGRRGEICQPKSRSESNCRRRGKFSLQMALEELWRCHLLLSALDCNLLIVVSGALYIRSGSLSECIDPRSGLKNPIKCVAARRWRWGSRRGHIPPEARLFSLQLSVHPVLSIPARCLPW
jgi:hypothetical protein